MTVTVEDLASLDPGQQIAVVTGGERTTWAKAEDGRFRHETTGAFVRPEVFGGYITAGTLTIVGQEPPEVGQVYIEAHYAYLVVGVEGDKVSVVRVYRDRFHSVTDLTAEHLRAVTRVTEPLPAWHAVALGLGQHAQALRQEIQVHRANPVPAPLLRALHGYSENTEDDDFDRILREHRIGRPTMHASLVRISGVVYHTPDDNDMRQKIGLGTDYQVDAGTVTVRWVRDVEVEKQGQGGSCTCGDIEEADLAEYLPPENMRNEIDWEVSCA